jgi:Winged helix-turn helix
MWGTRVAESTIYRLLDRHGWRKLMPRPKHPKASPEAQEQLKKTLQRRCKRRWRRGQPQIPGRSC